ncbi:cytochrome c-type biogenesis protein CcmH [Candidatus Berkiella aquae]|uniref:Cytochrome c-type biogenesis protein n=1 Tax=Candidatus Berkiella aquae TaxID=295108 RepID=A0A0Q9YL77_9GAMM|nr:cytochrome c-type biogenesis protein [Candidatus Berkiella aquae]MCS5711394.1 cytochrome c-type biogenesis protein CcmH [Candidatus Berkiella aquae]
MIGRLKLGAMVLCLLLTTGQGMAQETLTFETPQQAQTFQVLVKEFRCVTCPNQSIADSHAPVATAMREDVYRRLQAGESADSIRAYLLERYGDYVSYRPRMKLATWFLWTGPFILLGFGLLGYRQRVTTS